MRTKSACLAADGWDKGSWDLADLKKGLDWGFIKPDILRLLLLLSGEIRSRKFEMEKN